MVRIVDSGKEQTPESGVFDRVITWAMTNSPSATFLVCGSVVVTTLGFTSGLAGVLAGVLLFGLLALEFSLVFRLCDLAVALLIDRTAGPRDLLIAGLLLLATILIWRYSEGRLDAVLAGIGLIAAISWVAANWRIANRQRR